MLFNWYLNFVRGIDLYIKNCKGGVELAFRQIDMCSNFE